MIPSGLHPAFDPDVQYGEGHAQSAEEQLVQQIEEQIRLDVQQMQVEQHGAVMLERFTKLLVEVRDEQRTLTQRMDRLLSVIAGE